MKKVSAGIDIGGTNTVFGWVESNGNFLWRGKIKTNDYKVDEGTIKLDHIASNQKYYNTSKDLFNYKLITKSYN